MSATGLEVSQEDHVDYRLIERINWRVYPLLLVVANTRKVELTGLSLRQRHQQK